VDDEDALRHLLERFLVQLGYEVDTAETAESAWQRFQRTPGRYHLLIVDLTLPGMRGDELMRRALAADSSVRVILSSGYAYDLGALAPDCVDRAEFLQKPYLTSRLAERMDSLLKTRDGIASPSAKFP
jgi:DNA-binding response OmpR family regulator